MNLSSKTMGHITSYSTKTVLTLNSMQNIYLYGKVNLVSRHYLILLSDQTPPSPKTGELHVIFKRTVMLSCKQPVTVRFPPSNQCKVIIPILQMHTSRSCTSTSRTYISKCTSWTDIPKRILTPELEMGTKRKSKSKTLHDLRVSPKKQIKRNNKIRPATHRQEAAVDEQSQQWTNTTGKEHSLHSTPLQSHGCAALSLSSAGTVFAHAVAQKLQTFCSLRYSPNKEFLMRKSEGHEHYLNSSGWEITHCCSFLTDSANCVMRKGMSCPIRRHWRRHSTSTPPFYTTAWWCLQVILDLTSTLTYAPNVRL